MAKNSAENILPAGSAATEAQKRLEKYYKAQESEKKGKALAASIVTFSVVCFFALLVLILKLTGVGKTVVFSTDSNGETQTSVADEVEGTNLAEYLVGQMTE